MNFNRTILAGNLTRDPKLHTTPKGVAIANFGLAINRSWKSESGETTEEVAFVDVEAFGRQAEVIAQYVKKGRALLVEGRLRLDQWEDKETRAKRSRLVVVLESFQFAPAPYSKSDESEEPTLREGRSTGKHPPTQN